MPRKTCAAAGPLRSNAPRERTPPQPEEHAQPALLPEKTPRRRLPMNRANRAQEDEKPLPAGSRSTRSGQKSELQSAEKLLYSQQPGFGQVAGAKKRDDHSSRRRLPVRVSAPQASRPSERSLARGRRERRQSG